MLHKLLYTRIFTIKVALQTTIRQLTRLIVVVQERYRYRIHVDGWRVICNNQCSYYIIVKPIPGSPFQQ